MKIGCMAMSTQIVVMLISGCRVLHHTTLVDGVVYNQYVRMPVLGRIVPNKDVFRDLLYTKTLWDPAPVLHMIGEEFKCYLQVP